MTAIHNEHPFGWKPLPHPVFRDDVLREQIHTEGYATIPFLDDSQLNEIQQIYSRFHKLSDARGGMFYGVYSADLDYRRQTDLAIRQVLLTSFPSWFREFENPVNFFVSKLPGPASEFDIHQDMTSMDEFRYSPLSLWIPLQDTRKENGTICIVPRTHWLFSPYRGISWPFPFASFKPIIRKYLQPLQFSAGEALVFDPRILHSSLPNISSQPRVAVVSGIFPEGFEFINCFREPGTGNVTELYRQEKDWVLTYPNFLKNCHSRPVTGEVIGNAKFEFPEMNAEKFISFCKKNSIAENPNVNNFMQENCNMIGEPVMQEDETVVSGS